MTPLLVATLAFAADPPSSEALVAVVVVDQEARESGYALALDGFLIDDALPVDVVEGDELVLVDPAGRTEPLDVAMGEAWEITGSDGEAWMSTLEEEVRTDVIAVRAPAASPGSAITVTGSNPATARITPAYSARLRARLLR